MKKVEIKEYTPEQYRADMQKLLEEKGLKGAVEVYCDKIDEIERCLSYISHREIQEYLCDILFLIELDKGEESDDCGKG